MYQGGTDKLCLSVFVPNLLNVESDADYRTVVTFAGNPEIVKDAAFYAIGMTAEVTLHKGAHPRIGATVIGAREFLIACNVNLDAQDIQIANKISGIVRASGEVKINERGEKVSIAGLLGFVLARLSQFAPKKGYFWA
ncbi:MAG: hypothetical protein HUU08_06800 [Candidatus Brocadia sp.]|nr:hypothetical protein [Candidatus Brocadia sp.]